MLGSVGHGRRSFLFIAIASCLVDWKIGMTKDDIIRMAETQSHGWWLDDEKLEHFANLVADAEREACAVACDEQGYFSAGLCAAKIRARSLS